MRCAIFIVMLVWMSLFALGLLFMRLSNQSTNRFLINIYRDIGLSFLYNCLVIPICQLAWLIVRCRNARQKARELLKGSECTKYEGILEEIRIYPILSGRATQLRLAKLTDHGVTKDLLQDGILAIVDERGDAVLATDLPELSDLRPVVRDDAAPNTMTLDHPAMEAIDINLSEVARKGRRVRVRLREGGMSMPARDCGDAVAGWLNRLLHEHSGKYRMAYLPSRSNPHFKEYERFFSFRRPNLVWYIQTHAHEKTPVVVARRASLRPGERAHLVLSGPSDDPSADREMGWHRLRIRTNVLHRLEPLDLEKSAPELERQPQIDQAHIENETGASARVMRVRICGRPEDIAARGGHEETARWLATLLRSQGGKKYKLVGLKLKPQQSTATPSSRAVAQAPQVRQATAGPGSWMRGGVRVQTYVVMQETGGPCAGSSAGVEEALSTRRIRVRRVAVPRAVMTQLQQNLQKSVNANSKVPYGLATNPQETGGIKMIPLSSITNDTNPKPESLPEDIEHPSISNIREDAVGVKMKREYPPKGDFVRIGDLGFSSDTPHDYCVCTFRYE